MPITPALFRRMSICGARGLRDAAKLRIEEKDDKTRGRVWMVIFGNWVRRGLAMVEALETSREARIRQEGAAGASASTMASARPPGLTPVMRT
jgi:hypothetical protein